MSLKDRVFIRVYLGEELSEVFQSNEAQIVIGSEEESNIQLKSDDVSSVHALVEKRQDGFYVCDLGSTSGTFKNNKKILDEQILNGEEFFVGPYRLEFFIGLPKPIAQKKTQDDNEKAQKKELPKLEDRLVTDSKKVKRVQATPPPSPEEKPIFKDIQPKKIEEKPKEEVIQKKVEAPVEASPEPEIFQKTPKKAPVMASVEGGFERESETFKIPSHIAGTYAPKGQISDINEYIKPSKGSVVEVTVTWQERILDTYHFDSRQTVSVGDHPKNTISLPIFEGKPSHPLLKIDSLVHVFITSDMNGEVIQNEQKFQIHDLILKGKLSRQGVGYTLVLDQGSVVRIELGLGVVAHIRYVAPVPKPMAAPFFYLSTLEISTLVASFLIFGLMFLYFSIYSPDPTEQVQEEEVQRVAKFIYDRPKQRIELSQPPTQAKTTAQPIKDQEQAKSRGTEGKATEAMPNKSKSTVKKLTTPTPGTGSGIAKSPVQTAKKPDSGAQSAKPDPTKTGIFSAFGSKGTQDQLSQVYSGSGTLGGLAGKATGSGGAANVGAGDTPGTGLKDLGAGGEGTSTFGIAGVNTKGRGGGLTGYGTGNLGAKPRATIVPGGEGESFTGSIDREAIRRVIRENQRQIQACYEKTLNKQPGLYGKVILEWVITTHGVAKDARVASTTLGSSEVENCVLSRLRTWRFPEPPPDQEAIVTFPFLFNATN